MSQKKQFNFMSKQGRETFDLRIKLSADCQIFFSHKDLPPELFIHESMKDDGRSYFDDYDELRKSIVKITEDYKNSFLEEAREKVIVYFAESELKNHCDKLSIGYRVLTKVTLGDDVHMEEMATRSQRRKIEYDCHDFFGEWVDHECIREMPWTQEREDWFERVTKSMKTLSKEISSGILKKPDVLAEGIDNGSAQLKMLPTRLKTKDK